MSSADSSSLVTLNNLYNDHHGWLKSWLRRRLGCPEQAADLAHDTFIRILTKSQPLSVREPRAFLTCIAQGMVSNFRRRQRVERAYIEALGQLPEALVPSPEVQAIMLETLLEIDRLLDGLPTLVRRAFLLSQLDGLTQTEIAKRLGISVPTVKRYVAKALVLCCFAEQAQS